MCVVHDKGTFMVVRIIPRARFIAQYLSLRDVAYENIPQKSTLNITLQAVTFSVEKKQLPMTCL